MNSRMYGVDVSDNQGYIDWPRVKAAGVQFAILRSVRRSGNPDKQLASNIKGCIESGIPFDFYKYSYALTPAEARAEVKRVVEVLKGYGVAPNKNTVIWADIEDSSQMALTTDELTDIVRAFKEEVLAAGFEFGLYMGMYRYNARELHTTEFNDHIWIARYYNGYNVMPFSEHPSENYIPTVKAGTLWGWQYTSSGKVDGIMGNVDLDECYYNIKDTEVEPEYYQTPEFTLIDSLNKIGADSSYKNRAYIAVKNGIYQYSGTKEQNLKMLSLLNEGKLIK